MMLDADDFPIRLPLVCLGLFAAFLRFVSCGYFLRSAFSISFSSH